MSSQLLELSITILYISKRELLLPRWENLHDTDTRDGVRIIDLGSIGTSVSSRQHDVDLAGGWEECGAASWDRLDLQVTVGSAVGLDVVGVESGEENRVDLLVGRDKLGIEGVLVGTAEGDGR